MQLGTVGGFVAGLAIAAAGIVVGTRGLVILLREGQLGRGPSRRVRVLAFLKLVVIEAFCLGCLLDGCRVMLKPVSQSASDNIAVWTYALWFAALCSGGLRGLVQQGASPRPERD